MKRVVIWLIVAVMLCGLLPVYANAADVSWDSDIQFETAAVGSAMDIWGNYAFVAHSKGITITDLQKEKTVAEWKLDKSAIPGLSSFVPLKIEVNDKYIIINKADTVVVFPNTGAYTNTPPALIRRLGKFANVTRATVNGDYLYIFDKTANGTVTGVKPNTIMLWKIPLSELQDLKTNGSAANKYSILANCTNVERLNLGIYENIWSDIIVEDNIAYVTLFNNTSTSPYKTLFLKAVNLDIFSVDEVSETELYAGYLNSLTVTFDTEQPLSDTEIRSNFNIYISGEEQTASLADIKKSNCLITVRSLNTGGSRVTINLTDVDAVAEMFNDVTAAQLTNGTKSLCIDAEEKTYSFSKANATENYNDGNVLKAENTIYFMTKLQNANVPNYYIKAQVDGINCESIDEPKIMGYYTNNTSAFVGAVYFDGYIGGIVNGNDNNFYGFDTAAEFDGSVSINAIVKKGISYSNKFSDFIPYGGKIYYLLSDNSGIGILDTGTVHEFTKQASNGGNFPIIFHGASNGTITADIAGLTLDVPVEKGLWRLPVYSSKSGFLAAAVNGNDFNTEINVKPIIEILADENISAVNNCNLYGMNEENLIFCKTSYDSSGKEIGFEEVNESVKQGETKTIAFSAVPDETSKRISIFTSDRKPLASYEITGTDVKRISTEIAYGDISDITVDNVRCDYSNDTAIISGTAAGVGERAIGVTVKKNNTAVFSGIVNSDADGKLTIKYFYGNETPEISDIYKAQAIASFSNETAESEEFTLVDSSAVKEKTDKIKSDINTTEELYNYLIQDEELCRALGIDLKNSDFKGLSDSNQSAVLKKILDDIKADKISDIPSDFETTVNEKKKEETTAKAINEVNSAKASTLSGVLGNYKEEFSISDELWQKYQNMGTKISDVNTEFLNMGKISNVSDVASRLDKCIETVKNRKTNNTPSGGTSVSGSGGGRGNSAIDYTMTQNPPDKKDDTETVKFADVDDSHWAKAAIDSLAKLKIVSGMGDGIFEPDTNVTREQFIKMLMAAIGADIDGGKSSFTDLKEDGWYYPYIAKAEEIGLVKGNDGIFGLNSDMTRQDAAVFLYRAAQYKNIALNEESDNITFDDFDDISDYAVEAIKAMNANGIINGMDNNRFESHNPCTRAMAAKMIYGLLQLNEKE